MAVEAHPVISILIAARNAARLTLECVRHIHESTVGFPYEIIIVDNGSDREDIDRLNPIAADVRLIEIGTKRCIGEANNIAAEHARGQYLFFLSNRVIVGDDLLPALMREFVVNPGTGAVGPKFVFSGDAPHEAKCIVDVDGHLEPLVRDGQSASDEATSSVLVDYVSAAAFLIENELFSRIGGFELAYEPLYYEDADLCFKLLLVRRRARRGAAAAVTCIDDRSAHAEISEDTRAALQEINRQKFLARWGRYLKSRSEQDLPHARSILPSPVSREERVAASAAPVLSNTPRAAVYAPYNLAPGGGERFILTAAAALSQKFQVSIVTPYAYSSLRFRAVAGEFKVDLSRCDALVYEDYDAGPASDVMFVLGNHVIPSIHARGKLNWYVCQFPFPLDPEVVQRQRSVLDGYYGVITYSEYARKHFIRVQTLNDLPSLPTHVLYPPVPMIGGDAARKKNVILSVGRFFFGGHDKRHDAMIDAFRELITTYGGVAELHLAGAAVPEEPRFMVHLSQLMQSVEGLPVKFHVNPSTDDLWDMYRGAALYWHATGLGADLDNAPEKAEHFGISIAEAMSAECVPLAFHAGGPTEIIDHGADGFLYDTQEGLIRLTADLLRPDSIPKRVKIGRMAAESVARFSPEKFAARLFDIVDAAGDR